MRCPYCGNDKTQVIDTAHEPRGGIRRRRLCQGCNRRFSTHERAILSTPLIIKRGDAREQFSRQKLMAGLQRACEKRPVAAADLETVVDEVEAQLQHMGKAEVPSRLVGDLVLNRLKDLDKVAYIRFATVFLRLTDLKAVQDEINRLLAEAKT